MTSLEGQVSRQFENELLLAGILGGEPVRVWKSRSLKSERSWSLVCRGDTARATSSSCRWRSRDGVKEDAAA